MPDSRASLNAFRALSALFFYKIMYPAVFMVLIVMVALYVLTILLAITFSGWWLLLLILLIPLTIFLFAAGYFLWYLLKKLLPRRLDDHELVKLSRYTDKLFEVAEQVRLPYPVLLFLVAKDVLRGKESKFLRKIIGDSRSLMEEFGEIQEMFK